MAFISLAFVAMASPLGMALATTPQLSISLLFVPAATSVLFAGVLYIFVMPLLTSFAGLGLMIFAATFAICYLFAAPRQTLGRAFGLACSSPSRPSPTSRTITSSASPIPR